MSRLAATDSSELFSIDSFLDVITNVVGIMIVLVLIVGLRAGQTAALSQATPAAPGDSPGEANQEWQIADVIQQTEAERMQLNRELSARNTERDRMLQALAGVQQELQARRARLDSPSQARFDQEQSLSAMKTELEKLDRERVNALSAPRNVQTVRHNPTPLSKMVVGKEVHFQLRRGRIALVPFDELVDKMGYLIRDRRPQMSLSELATYSDTVGPMAGFHLHFQLAEVARGTVGVGSATFIPERADLGEPLAAALADNSLFRRTLSGAKPNDTTITLWTYPDSGQEYLELNKVLHDQGYAVAARPMPDGINIGGSYKGSRSSAQ